MPADPPVKNDREKAAEAAAAASKDDLSDQAAVGYALLSAFTIIVILLPIGLLSAYGLPDGNISISDSITSANNQKHLITKVNRQLIVWPTLGRHLAEVSYFLGSMSAALTVIIGFMKNRTNVKMLMMAISASISFLMGAMQPGEQSSRYLNAFRSLYDGVVGFQAKASVSQTEFDALAKSLAEAERSLSTGKR